MPWGQCHDPCLQTRNCVTLRVVFFLVDSSGFLISLPESPLQVFKHQLTTHHQATLMFLKITFKVFRILQTFTQ